jgi:hypothetical protein
LSQEFASFQIVGRTRSAQGFVVALNAGSSSLKFALFAGGTMPVRILSGAVDLIELPEATFSLRRIESQQTEHAGVSAPNHASCLDYLLKRLAETLGTVGFQALGHRVVQGGERYTQPQLVNFGDGEGCAERIAAKNRSSLAKAFVMGESSALCIERDGQTFEFCDEYLLPHAKPSYRLTRSMVHRREDPPGE